jgi:lambda family phage portal protein
MALPRFLDRLLGRVAPPVRTRGFEAGRPPGTRWNDRPFGPINSEIGVSASAIRRRARAAAANNPHLAAAASAWATNLVGYGVQPTPQHADAAARAALLDYWRVWTPRADLAGILAMPAILETAARALVVDGEAFFRLIATSDGLRLQQIPAELVSDESRELAGGGAIVNGVELDATGRRVAFWIYPASPLLNGVLSPVRIPASEILHVFRPLLPGQTRGVSGFAPVLLRAHELDQLCDALLVGAKIGAMFAGVVTDMNATGPNPFTADAERNGNDFQSGLEPGTLKVLPSGFDVKFGVPRQAQQTAEFVRHQIRSIAAGLGLPAHLISADLSEANYGSLRAGMIAFRQAAEAVQHNCLVPMLLQPTWERLVALGTLRGDLVDLGDDAFRVDWLFPRAPWLDPQKDAQAEAAMIAAGLKSRRQAVAELGFSVEQLDQEIASDRQRETALGLSFGAAPATTTEPPAND